MYIFLLSVSSIVQSHKMTISSDCLLWIMFIIKLLPPTGKLTGLIFMEPVIDKKDQIFLYNLICSALTLNEPVVIDQDITIKNINTYKLFSSKSIAGFGMNTLKCLLPIILLFYNQK